MAKNKNYKSITVDRRANRPQVAAKRQIDRIHKAFRNYLRSSSILGLVTVADDPDLVSNYFLRSRFYQNLFGSSYIYVQRCFAQAVMSVISKDIIEEFAATADRFPGLWNEFTIQTLVITRIRTVMLSDDVKRGFILSANITPPDEPFTTEQLESYEPRSYMLYDEYTPEKLADFCVVVRNTTINRILGEIREYIPAGMLTNNETLDARYGREFGEIIARAGVIDTYNNRLNDPDYGEDENGYRADKDMGWQATQFMGLVGEQLLGYVTLLLSESGFAGSTISRILKESKATVFYSTSPGKKEASAFIHPWVKLSYQLTFNSQEGEQQFAAKFDGSPNDIALSATIKSEENPTLSDDTLRAQTRVGAAIFKFIKSMIRYIINVQAVLSLRPAPVDDDVEDDVGDDTMDIDADSEEPEVGVNEASEGV